MADKKVVERKEVAKKKVEDKKALSSTFAVIKTGGKQYLVREGDKVLVEKTGAGENEKIEFSDVLLLSTDKEVKVGDPLVKDAKVEATVLAIKKLKKVTVFKMKAKKRYRKTQGHRQEQAQVQINKI